MQLNIIYYYINSDIYIKLNSYINYSININSNI